MTPVTPDSHATPLAPRNAPYAAQFRIGHGYDLHRLEPQPPEGEGRAALVLGCIRLEHPQGWGPVSHSDGDAVAHAVTDALLGALAMPDLGTLFPNTDPRHAGEDSSAYLIEAARRVRQAGWEIGNVDCTVILERPKIGPVRSRISQAVAGHLGVAPEAVNIKGKTHEGLDALGEGRAVEVHAVTLLVRGAASAAGVSGGGGAR